MRIRFAAALLTALALAGCSKVTSPSSNQIDNFTGTITPLGTVQHNFSVPNTGEYSITIVSLTPSPTTTAFLTIALGFNQNGACSLISQQPFAIIGQQALGGSINQGSYCVIMSDTSGSLKQAESYTLKVSHP